MKSPPPRRRVFLGILLSVGFVATGFQMQIACAGEQSPRVVASIAPVHSLVSMVMAGVGEPALLLPGTASPHTYHLKPSDADLLEKAQAVFWIGPALEAVLAKPLKTIAAKAISIELMDARAMRTLPFREGGLLAHDDHDHDTDHKAGDPDPHIWLDPANAIVMLFVISETLGEVDPDHAAVYRANAIAGIERITKLDTEIEQALSSVRGRAYVSFHDAYQYFETRYGLQPLATISVNPDHAPGARRVDEVRTAVAQSGARCVFTEPQFDPKLVSTLIEGTAARAGKLDPLGAGIASGPYLYDEMMRALAESLITCLGGN